MTYDRQTVLDASRLRPSLRESIVSTYRDLAAFDRAEGRHDLADYSERRAAALEYGGTISFAELSEEALP